MSGADGQDLVGLVDPLSNRFCGAALHRAGPRASAMPERSVARPSALAAPGGAAWDGDLPRPARMLSRPELV